MEPTRTVSQRLPERENAGLEPVGSKRLMSPLAQPITRSIKLAEQDVGKRMHDFLRNFRRLQVSLCDIGRMIRSIHEHMVPWLVFGRARTSHLLIPFVRSLKDRIGVINHAEVIEQLVMDDLSDLKSRYMLRHGCHRLKTIDSVASPTEFMAAVPPMTQAAVAGVCLSHNSTDLKTC